MDFSSLKESDHKKFMGLALEMAEKACSESEVPVGCVIVHVPTGEVIGRGSNTPNRTRNATRHAEFVATDEVLLVKKHKAEIFPECALYVTCEPCIMCAAALEHLRMGMVVFGCHNERFGGCGSILAPPYTSPGYKFPTITGVFEDEAVALFRKFYSRENERAPEIKRRKHNPTSVDEA